MPGYDAKLSRDGGISYAYSQAGAELHTLNDYKAYI